ncbi:MAG: hypothetical protein J5858_03530 [Lentisphaeria bacterium]|nr:hypothetical protein [Lentisphaeria bacterium]
MFKKTITAGILALIAAAPLPVPGKGPAGIQGNGIVTTMAPLTTKRPYLPRRKSGYAFVSNIEQIAYVASEQSSMIHFMPVNPTHKPELCILLPPEIELQGAFRELAVGSPSKYMHNGREMDLYHVKTAGPRVSKYTFFWRLREKLPEGTQLEGFYWGEWSKGKQEPQSLKVQVVSIPAAEPFKDIPVYLSMPNDFYAEYPDMAGLRRCGFNYLDMWTYLTGSEREWGENLLDKTLRKAGETGIRVIAWIREWWWHNGQKDPDGGMAVMINGEKTNTQLCLSYRGKWYQALIEQGKFLIDRNVYFHCTDPEMYRDGDRICFCDSCKNRFREFLSRQKDPPSYLDPAEFEKDPEKHSRLHRLWNEFKCWSYTEFFAEYRRAMEAYMKEKGIQEPFRFIIYSTYHRSFPGLTQYKDYKTSHTYLKTLEDPASFVGVFDYIAPMIYMDVYANYKDYDLLLPRTDTEVLIKITGNRVPVTPILCAGYPFFFAFGSDLNAEMLKYNMLEVLAGGGKGFGFWGECPFDAADMKAVAQVVKMLGPYEKIILNGQVNENVRVVSGNALARRLTFGEGNLILVSEYSRRSLKVELECPVTVHSRVIDLAAGEQIAEISPDNSRFTMVLDKERAVMLYVGK